MANSTAIGLAAIVVIILVVGGAYFLLGNHYKAPTGSTGTGSSTTPGSGSSAYPTGSSSSSSKSTPILMTDPPSVPAGTQAAVVTYSALKVDESSPSGLGWVNATGSGSVNLMSVVNSSQVIGYANLTANTTISAVRFVATSAYVTINNTRYNVTIPNSTVNAQVNGQSRLNASSAVLVDMATTISAVYNSNTTAFVMAPSAKAALVSNSSINGGISIGLGIGASTNVGAMISINAGAKATAFSPAPSITITSATLSSANNMTTLTVNVKDNSNSSVTVSSVALYGPTNVTGTASASAGGVVGIGGGLTSGGGALLNTSVKASAKTGVRTLKTVAFGVGSSGSMSLWTSIFASNSGVAIAPGSSATLTFAGKMTYPSYTATTVSGSSYNIVVVGNGGAVAQTTVTGH